MNVHFNPFPTLEAFLLSFVTDAIVSEAATPEQTLARRLAASEQEGEKAHVKSGFGLVSMFAAWCTEYPTNDDPL